jgi:hypothetical protein
MKDNQEKFMAFIGIDDDGEDLSSHDTTEGGKGSSNGSNYA